MDRKIRVLHILDELNTGGAERIVFSYFQHIDREKFQWDFVITRHPDPHHKGMLEDAVEAMGSKIYRVTRKRENYFKNLSEIRRIIRDGNYDIVHSHLDELSALYLLSAKSAGVPVRICHSHLAVADRGFAVETLCKLLKPVLNACVTDRFACGRTAGISLWGEKAVNDGSVFIMRNAIDTESFHFNEETRKAMRDKLDLENKTVIGSVGRLSYQKNTAFLIEIFNEYHKRNPDSVLVLVGEGEFREKVLELIDEHLLNDCVRLLGARNDVNEIMCAMDLFLLPSRFEGLPIVMVEAQCSGLPCAVSDRITDEVRINPNVIYLPIVQSAKFWAQKCDELIRGNTLSRQGAQKAVEDSGYRIETSAKELEDYYLSALKK